MWGLVHGLVMIELAGVAPAEVGGDPASAYSAAVEVMLNGFAA
jgi:hypothetical protein